MLTAKLVFVASFATVFACQAAVGQTAAPNVAPQAGTGIVQLACPGGTEVLVLIQQTDAPVSVIADEIPAAGQGAATRLNVATVAANAIPATVDLSPFVHDLDVLVSVRPASGNNGNQLPSNLDGYIGCGQWQARLAAGMPSVFLLQRARKSEPPATARAQPEPKPAPRQTQPSPDDLGRLIEQAVAEKSTCTGVAAGVRVRGISAWRFFGTTGNRGAPTADTEFELGAITDTFTGALLAWADREGRMHLDDPLEKFAPSRMPSWQGQPIQLLQLADHTSGLPLTSNARTADDVWEFVKRYQMTRAPGAQYTYSALGVSVLGLALAREHRWSLADLYARVITRPLGMPDTAIELSAAQQASLAWGHGSDGQRAQYARPAFPGQGAAYAMHSTLRDMMRYLEFELGEAGSPLDSLLPVLQQQRHAVTDERHGIGLGWYTYNQSDGTWSFYKMGRTYGFSSTMSFSRSKHMGVVVLANHANCGATETAYAVVRGLGGVGAQTKATGQGEDF